MVGATCIPRFASKSNSFVMSQNKHAALANIAHILLFRDNRSIHSISNSSTAVLDKM